MVIAINQLTVNVMAGCTEDEHTSLPNKAMELSKVLLIFGKPEETRVVFT